MTQTPVAALKLPFLRALACLVVTHALLVSAALPAQGQPSDLRTLVTTCLQLINSGHILDQQAITSLKKAGFVQDSSWTAGGTGIHSSLPRRTASVIGYERTALRRGGQYSLQYGFSGQITSGPGAGLDEWTLCLLGNEGSGTQEGFYLMFPGRLLSYSEVEGLLATLRDFAGSWTGSMIENNTWVWDFTTGPHGVMPAGNRLSCYSTHVAQGSYQVTLIFSRDAQVMRHPMGYNTPRGRNIVGPTGFANELF